MGLGILFVGYFLLLNFAYSYFTDAIAAAVMLYALYKLSGINASFKRAMFASAAFLVLGLSELALSVVNTFSLLGDILTVYSIIAMMRHGLIFITTLLTLLGIKELSDEVELPELSRRAVRNISFAFPVYSLNIILEAGELANFIPETVLRLLYLVCILLTMTVIVLNLLLIYGTHMRVYIPGEEKTEEKSKFGFVNSFRAHEEEKQREYAEYRLTKLKNKKRKKK